MGSRLAPSGFASLALLALACGGHSPTSSATTDGSGGSLGLAPVVDPGAETPWAGPYPASHTSLPLVSYNGGAVLESPDIVTVAFDDDPLDEAIAAFTSKIAATSWWKQVR